MVPRALICTVGGEPRPIVNAVEQNDPLDRIYFLCSTGKASRSSDTTVEQTTVRKVEGRCPHCGEDFTIQRKLRPIVEMARLSEEHYVIERVKDPDSLVDVIQACERIDDDIRKRWPGEKVEVLANYTGGTKTMSLALGFYTIRKRGSWVLQLNRIVEGGRTNLTRIDTGDVALPQDVSRLLADFAAERAETLDDRHDYEGAIAVLSTVLTQDRLRSEDQQRLLARRVRFALWAAWDRLAYQEALNLALQHPDLAAEHARRLQKLLKIVSHLGAYEPWPRHLTGLELVEDLRANAERAAVRGRYDDAVGRLYRATELLAQLRLRRGYDIHTHAVDSRHPQIPERVKAALERHRTLVPNTGLPGSIKIGLLVAYQLLADMGDALGTYFMENKSALLNLIEKRNSSLFAHGLTPIDREVWIEIGPKWNGWLERAQRVCR